MPRQRLGVALLLPAPASIEVDGLRRALGDGALGRIPAHVTLVPPVNVPVDRVPDALAVLRDAAASAEPLRLRLGPPATFHPVTPVVHLAVGGDLDALRSLRDRVFVPPLARSLTHPFVPHVTLADDLAPERIPAALAALAEYRATVTVDRVHLLREHREDDGRRVWRAIADAPCAPAAIVGRGGLPLEITLGDEPGPDADPLAVVGAGLGRPLAAVARRDGAVVGVARGTTLADGLARLDAVVVVEGERRQGIGRHLLAAAEAAMRRRGCTAAAATAPDDPAVTALLTATGWHDAGPAGLVGPAAAGAAWRRWERRLPT